VAATARLPPESTHTLYPEIGVVLPPVVGLLPIVTRNCCPYATDCETCEGTSTVPPSDPAVYWQPDPQFRSSVASQGYVPATTPLKVNSEVVPEISTLLSVIPHEVPEGRPVSVNVTEQVVAKMMDWLPPAVGSSDPAAGVGELVQGPLAGKETSNPWLPEGTPENVIVAVVLVDSESS